MKRQHAKMSCNGKAEGVFETKCGVIDCTLNDRTCIDNGYGFCHCDDREVDNKGYCASYHQDFMFIAYMSKTEYIGGKYSKYLRHKILPEQDISIEPSTLVVTEPISDTIICEIGVVYICNCIRCGRLHFWNKKTAIELNFKYRCMECGRKNSMKERPPTQSKFSFEEKGEVKVEIPNFEGLFKVGDKVKISPEYSHMKGIFIVDSILWEWGEPLYIVSRTDGKETLSTFCSAEAMIKVE